MKEEYDALMKNGTWSLVPRASNTDVVDGSRYTGIDFHETFSLVVSATIRVVLSLAVTNNWPLHQLDVHNAFLYGNIKERVYMKQPLALLIRNDQNILDNSTAFSNLVIYRQVVGSLQYVTLSRPDIAFAVNEVCQYMHAPTKNHWSTVKWILRYPRGMLICHSSGTTLQASTDVIWKGNHNTSLEAVSDADYAGDSDDRRSTGRFAIYILCNNPLLHVIVRLQSFN
uniref:Reverse transcriptase Ty1/copia-type domain-containing protein n=1 Tax=Tanacetum cinerariifolium TaxID=118510 RepID=A0A6L2KVL7_TANCI|nr:hypothetical protein [Tanacetum cinerariifolium]